MEIKKILWPTDFSASAEKALPYLTSLSQTYQTEVHLLYVIDDLAHQDDPWYGEFDKSHMNKLYDWEKNKAKTRLDEICESHLKGCPLYIKHIAIGNPAREILKFIDEEKPDVVVMASKGRTGHFKFGSVAEKVVKGSNVPVVTIPIGQE